MERGVPKTQQADLLALLTDLADAAAGPALRHFRQQSLEVANKAAAGGFDPVTAADRAVETVLRDILAARCPDDAILGEEHGARAGTSGRTWVLDPIDGTRAFMAGIPLWGTLIALVDADGPLMGMIAQPFIGERFVGGFGQAMFVSPGGSGDLAVRACATLSDAVVLSTYPEVGTPAEGAAFAAVSRQCRLTRYGTDCYGYALVARGQVDLVIEAGLESYDICGPQAVIEAAGGIVTTWDGGPAHHGGRIIAAGDARVHAQALEILAQAG